MKNAFRDSRFDFSDFDFTTYGNGECSRSLCADIVGNEYTRLADLPKMELRGSRVLIIAATENDARNTYARVMQYFPLQIVVLCFIKNSR